MILIALGSNKSGPWGTPRQTIEQALGQLKIGPLKLIKASSLIETPPFGRKNQANFINAVARVETHLPPEALMRRLHQIEHEAGRRRALRWGPRTLDLDLIDYHGLIRKPRGHIQKALILPHPGIGQRRFVVQPIAEIAPAWRHPITHQSAVVILRKL
jgi:2-amino-4-hydroxy-6-hydroxymethyldihydropteridine diphosphokinase